MAILAGYFDDSGTHKESQIVTVAGAIASVPQWVRFSRQWKKQLKDWGLEFFHMADFVSGYDPYEGWDEAKKEYVLGQLIRTIKDHVRFLVGNAVYTKDFQAAFQKFPNPCIKDQHNFCSVLTLPAVGYWKQKSERRQPVALIFETGNKLMDKYFRMIQEDFSNENARQAFGGQGSPDARGDDTLAG